MRVISQCGTIDVPYEYFSFNVARSNDGKGIIFCRNLSSPNGTKLAEYSTVEKAKAVLEDMRISYARIEDFFIFPIEGTVKDET